MRKILAMFMVCVLTVVTLVGCGNNSTKESTADPSTKPAETKSAEDVKQDDKKSGKIWKIALSNSFVGNDYRQEMQKIAEYVAASDKYKDQVKLDIINCDNTAEAQAASIDSIVMDGYDAILIDACSPTALNDAIKRATDAGLVVISFDQTVTAESAIKIGMNFGEATAKCAEYLCASIGYKGKVVVDRGLAGAQGSLPMYDEPMKVFAKYPDIEVVAEFDGNYAQGDTLKAMESIIASNPEIDAVYSQGYCDVVIEAFEEAGREPVPTCGFTYNCDMLSLIQNNVDGILIHNPAGLSATAMVMALNELNGVEKYDRTKNIDANYQLYAMNPGLVDLDKEVMKIELNVNAFPDMPDGFQIPNTDDIVGVEVPNDLFK